MAEKEKKKLLGELLVEYDVIDVNQLNEALRVQKNRGGLLGGILLELNYLDEKTLVKYLTLNHARPRLGELLVAMNVLNREQIKKALTEQKKTGEKLGMVLINLGYLDKRTLIHYLTLQAQSLMDRISEDIDEAKGLIE